MLRQFICFTIQCNIIKRYIRVRQTFPIYVVGIYEFGETNGDTCGRAHSNICNSQRGSNHVTFATVNRLYLRN